MADHLGLDLNRVEDLLFIFKIVSSWGYEITEIRTHLAVVDADDRPDHLRDDDHVTEVGLDDGGLLIGRGLLLGLAQLLDEAHRAALETALEPPACAGVDQVDELFTYKPK